jgi:hypothetical protein
MLSAKLTKSTRIIHYTNFSKIKTIGIVWDASNPQDFPNLSKFYHRMTELKKEVTVFGFFPGKILPDQYIAVQFMTCLKKNEVDFFYRPVSVEAQNFIKTRFDLLIDLNFQKHFTLMYMTTLSEALLKVGLTDLNPESSPFDLMISLKTPVGIDNYFEQVIYYLEMINAEQVRKAV